MPITIYHNPRCSKSRQTLSLLEAQGAKPTIIEYLENPPSTEELQQLAHKLKLPPRKMLRSKEPEFVTLGLDDATLSDGALFQAIHEHPKLLERPIVVNGHKAAIGRPPESVLEIL